MNLKIYQVDAFTDQLFSGNPAAVCPLNGDWLPNSILQNIAKENNLSETAFYVLQNNQYHIRWFTPKVEVDLCGHATLATSHVLFNHENYKEKEINFDSRSGSLSVRQEDGYIVMNFPTDTIQKTNLSGALLTWFDIKPIEAWQGLSDYMLVFENEDQIKNIKYNLEELKKVNTRGIIITAKGKKVDFVSRFFAPYAGIEEDPVTGSAHTTLTPYWSAVLNKNDLTAMQLSERTGFIKCKYLHERTEISGKAKTYLKGEITI
jgi:PhzF family phenazine biosynthesis protein